MDKNKLVIITTATYAVLMSTIGIWYFIDPGQIQLFFLAMLSFPSSMIIAFFPSMSSEVDVLIVILIGTAQWLLIVLFLKKYSL